MPIVSNIGFMLPAVQDFAKFNYSKLCVVSHHEDMRVCCLGSGKGYTLTLWDKQ